MKGTLAAGKPPPGKTCPMRGGIAQAGYFQPNSLSHSARSVTWVFPHCVTDCVRGRPSKDARLMVHGVLWILRTGAPWRDLPAEFGPWRTMYKRFNAWTNLLLWQDILAALAQGTGLEAVLSDGSYVRAQHPGGCKPGPRGIGVPKFSCDEPKGRMDAIYHQPRRRCGQLRRQ